MNWKRNTIRVSAFTLWISLIVVCFGYLMVYMQTEGEIGMPVNASHAGIQTHPQLHTLVMAIHPKCSCSAASKYELERLIRRCDRKVACTFVVYQPEQADHEWFAQEERALERQFPNATIVSDPSGKISQRLGAVTSGSTVLYTPKGTPVFWGGITSARAHAGDNLGSDSIYAILNGDTPAQSHTLVYGCPITEISPEHLLGQCVVDEIACIPVDGARNAK